jgi:oxygen-dependent protoporphyrinogen oxidase
MALERQVVVIGGGITGLSAAYYLRQQAEEQGIPLQIRLAERQSKLGGDIQTEVFDGHVIEKGPDSFLRRKLAAANLCIELGLTDDLVGTNPANKKTYILHQGKLHRIPQGLSLGVPTEFMPFATTPLLSMQAKVRAALDILIPKGKVTGDQSLGGFLARRLGDQVVDKIAEPLLAGIYAGNSRSLSLRATFPQFEELEQKHGSLIMGMLAQARQAKAAQKQTQANSETGTPPSAANADQRALTNATEQNKLPQTAFITLRGGLIQLINRLADVLGPEIIHTSTSVKEIKCTQEQPERYQVVLDNGDKWDADAVIVTTPTFEAARLLPSSFDQKALLEKVPYVSTATVVMGFNKSDVPFPLDGTGFLVPRTEARDITACTWTSSKWKHTAPTDKAVIRCYVGRAGNEMIVEDSDESILQKVRDDLKFTMGITAEPYYADITRWRRAMPQYTVGHLDRIAAFTKEADKRFTGVYFAGSGYTGLGLPDCIKQGKDAAGRAVRFLQTAATTQAQPQ